MSRLCCLTVVAMLCWMGVLAGEVPPPGITISFQRSDLEIGDTIFFEVGVVNHAPTTLSDLTLTMAGPAFIAQHAIGLDSLPAYSAHTPGKFYLVINKKGEVGDFTLLF